MQELYNEGRVVGLSAYELYARHHMETFGDDPDNLPASEREWLASTISLGTSLLIQMSPTGSYTSTKTFDGGDSTDGHYWGVEIKIPTKARLCAANTIIASLFLGQGELDSNNKPFCKSVKDYGFLSSDTGQSNYDTMAMSPADAKSYDSQIREYMKLIDGVVIHPCEDYTKYVPDLHDTSKIRLLFRSKIETTFYILLSGFSDCSVINGTSIHMEGSKNTDRPETGDFLGPVVFPWSSKIIISTPSAAVSRLFTEKFARKLETSDNTSIQYSGVTGGDYPYKVRQDAIVDYNHAHMEEFYTGVSKLANRMSRLRESVTQYTPLGDGINQIAVVSKDAGKYDLPSLFGASVDLSGNHFVYPIDCAAPGTIKGYPEGTTNEEFLAFSDNRPGSYPVIMKNDGTMYRVIIENGQVISVPVADMVVKNFTPTKSGQYVVIKIGRSKQAAAPVIPDNQAIVYNDSADNVNGDYVVDATYMNIDNTDIAANFVSMRTFIYAATQNKRLDLLGDPLRLFRNNLQRISDVELTCHIKINFSKPMVFNEDTTFNKNIAVGGDVTVGDHLIMTWHRTRSTCGSAAAGSKQPVEAHIDMLQGNTGVGNNAKFAIGLGTSGSGTTRDAGYITLPNGLRLYISKNKPVDSDIPVGSIGIGW